MKKAAKPFSVFEDATAFSGHREKKNRLSPVVVELKEGATLRVASSSIFNNCLHSLDCLFTLGSIHVPVGNEAHVVVSEPCIA